MVVMNCSNWGWKGGGLEVVRPNPQAQACSALLRAGIAITAESRIAEVLPLSDGSENIPLF